MRVLIGCEESGTVRDAFLALGHDAWSNDLIPARNGGPHLQMCVRQAIQHNGPWDIIILHPDCTAMAVSGNRWYGRGTDGYPKRVEALGWTITIWDMARRHARVGCALENPVGVLWHHIGKPQYIQPWMFGHGETKKTGIIVHNLPPLIPGKSVAGREQKVWRMAPGPNRKRDRSKTYEGIAKAMAEQWGSFVQDQGEM